MEITVAIYHVQTVFLIIKLFIGKKPLNTLDPFSDLWFLWTEELCNHFQIYLLSISLKYIVFNRKLFFFFFQAEAIFFSNHLSYLWKSLSHTEIHINKSLPHFIGFWCKFSTGHSSLNESYISSVASLVMSSWLWLVVLKLSERHWKIASQFLPFCFSSACPSWTAYSYFSN